MSRPDKTPRPNHARTRHLAKRVRITFSLAQPEAQEVYVCGDFNQWSSESLRMIRQPATGGWVKSLTLEPGRYQYKFLADGKWLHDPDASENIANQYGSLNSVVEVLA